MGLCGRAGDAWSEMKASDHSEHAVHGADAGYARCADDTWGTLVRFMKVAVGSEGSTRWSLQRLLQSRQGIGCTRYAALARR